MPDYRVGYLLTYRVSAASDGVAVQKVVTALGAQFPAIKVELQSVAKSASQATPGSTAFDVQVIASGVVTATSVADSLTKVTPPAQNQVSSTLFASVDTRALGLF